MKRIVYLVIVLILLAAGFFAFNSYIYNEKQGGSQNPEPSQVPGASQITSDPDANIRVSSPAVNAEISLPFKITGEARVFENVLNYRVKDEDGGILAEGNSYADAPDIGLYGPYEIIVETLPDRKSDNLVIEVFVHSAKDGSEIEMVKIPVKLK